MTDHELDIYCAKLLLKYAAKHVAHDQAAFDLMTALAETL